MRSTSEAGEIKSNRGNQINTILPLPTRGPSYPLCEEVEGCCWGFALLGGFFELDACAFVCLPGSVALLLSING